MNAYELPIGTEIIIGKRSWRLTDRTPQHPDLMYFRETTAYEPHPKSMDFADHAHPHTQIAENA